MSVLPPLSPASVENVYVFVCDALRRDELPASVADLGVTVPTLANALCTPQSVPTILSGRYPPNHGVNWFDQSVPADVPTLLDGGAHGDLTVAYNELVWGGSPITGVLRDPPSVAPASPEPPFLVVEHDHGGHTPYPGEMDRPTADVLGDIPDTETLRTRYREGVAESAGRFHDRLDRLAERGVLADTLVVFTSDHGELLGEYGGFVGHAFPVAPEVVSVPTVFVHDRLPASETHTAHVRHVDLAPTIDDLRRGPTLLDGPTDGRSLLTGAPEAPSYTHAHVPANDPFRGSFLDPIYVAPSVWDADGGRVFVERSVVHRTAMAVYDALQSGYTAAFNRGRNPVGRLRRSFGMYWPTDRTFGEPAFSRTTAREIVRSVRTGTRTTESRELDERTRRDLRDLGYR
jgi:arylsulfatase A-like enzyme